VFAVFACLFLISYRAAGYIVVETNLPDIVANSDVAFRGICETREVKTIYPPASPNGIVVTHYKFKVMEALKGDPGETFEFDLYGVASRKEARSLGAPFAVGFMQFDPGKEYVVFLGSPSPKSGLRAPYGMEQGVFNVIYTADGKAAVVNSYKNANLFKNIRVNKTMNKALKAGNVNLAEPPAGPMSYDDFKAVVENLK
jgi:hypothetical protein